MPSYLGNRSHAQGWGSTGWLAGRQASKARVSRPEVVLVLGVAP